MDHYCKKGNLFCPGEIDNEIINSPGNQGGKEYEWYSKGGLVYP